MGGCCSCCYRCCCWCCGCCCCCCPKKENSEEVQDGYQCLPSPPESRNIILFGKTGSGKATVANHIFGSPEFSVSTSIGGITRSVKDSTARKKVSLGGSDLTYTIKLVDTAEASSTKLDTQRISSEVQNFAESVQSSGGIHLVLFVFSRGRFTKEDKNAYDFIIRKYQQYTNISALVITHCEGLDDSTRKKTVTEFQTEESTRSIANAMDKGILTVGFPDLTTVKEELKSTHKDTMKTDEETLKNLVVEASQGILISPRQ